MAEAEARIEFRMDDAYFREFHREWIAAVGKGWRVDRLMIPLFAALALVVAAAAWLAGAPRFHYLAGGLLAVAAFEGSKYLHRRRAWLGHCRSLPWYGKPMRIALRGGELVQENDYPGSPGFQRTGALVVTPHGYLVRYVAVGAQPSPGAAVSSVDASVYVPHRAIAPAMSRDEFLQRVAAAPRAGR